VTQKKFIIRSLFLRIIVLFATFCYVSYKVNNVIKYTAGYIKANPNFVIQNADFKNQKTQSSLAVLNNVFQRGFPTLPSKFLKEQFGDPEDREDVAYFLDSSDINWDRTIKGGNETNPARVFYNEVLPSLLGDKNAKTFIPEFPLGQIIYGLDEDKADYRVDFYSPLYGVVIEIDGSQHITDKSQLAKDFDRDEILTANLIKVIRIPARKADNLFEAKPYLTGLRMKRKCLIKEDSRCSSLIEKKYLIAIRVQMLLIKLLESGKIDDNTIMSFWTPDSIDKGDFELAISKSVDDFYRWMSNVSNLFGEHIVAKKIGIIVCDSEEELSKSEGIKINISIERLYSETKNDDVIYIRNDYFEYKNSIEIERDEYSYFKNYCFFQTTDDFSFSLSEKKHKDNLEFLLTNLSQDYDGFRENQFEIIIECLNNTSAIGILPTGAGKSLCYQIVSLLIPGFTIVVSPLQLLMVDQYQSIQRHFGITNHAYINAETKRGMFLFENKQSLLTIVSPERFFNDNFTRLLKKNSKDIHFVVIDEAHCLSEWGHDFRTSYLCLSHNLKNYLSKNTYLMALTGTASHRVFDDIDVEFSLFKNKKTKAIFAKDMERPNLSVNVVEAENLSEKYQFLKGEIYDTLHKKNDDKTLVFTKLKKGASWKKYESSCIFLVQEIKEELQYDKEADLGMISFFAGGDELTSEEKNATLREFRDGSCKIMFATKAFGMGVDIPNIRKTIHYGLPSSFESLYQEIGRAGRDGIDSKCLIYYSKEEPAVLKKYFSLPPISMKEMEENLNSLKELETNFFFIQNSNLDIDAEYWLVKRIYEGIQKRKNLESDFFSVKDVIKAVELSTSDEKLLSIFNEKTPNFSACRTLIERCLYRLFLLGEIEMWSMVYTSDISNPTFSRIKCTDKSDDQKLDVLCQYIGKYETNFMYLRSNTFDDRLFFLLDWINKNYLQERIQTLKTLYEQCEGFTDSQSFMHYISGYFMNDPLYTRLVSRGCTTNDWIEALKPNPLETVARIARLLESFEKMAPLNYVSGITRLRLNDFDNNDGKRRLIMALEEVKGHSNFEKRKLIVGTLNIIDDDIKEDFIDCWVSVMPEDTRYIYDLYDSKVCEKLITLNFVKELLEAGEKLNDKLQ